jgi:hypothetical protein
MLRRHGIPVWYSRTNIRGAQKWHDEIGAAIRRCDWFVIALSRSSVESAWVKRELLYALQQAHLEHTISPLVLTPCDFDKLSWTLSIFQMVDFSQSFEAGSRDLLRVWDIGFVPPQVRP